ncbi:MAG: caspase family protein [Pseudomonadota bacterium]
MAASENFSGRLRAGLLGTVALAAAALAPAAHAQSSSYLEQLVSGSGSIAPLRSIDIETPAERRYALVIGNSGYSAIPALPNATADADAMAAFLRGQDYIVEHHSDLTKRGFEDALRRILFDVDQDTNVVIFYAGHGFQIGSENYLVPVDADLDSVYDIPFETVSLSSLVAITGARARLQLVILDSCRDNPFVGREQLTALGSDLRETRTGFASLSAPLNSMLVYSTAPGALAFDGEGDHSPFTAALLNEVAVAPNAEVGDIFEGVRRAVYTATNGRQVPWDSSTLIEPTSLGTGGPWAQPLQLASLGTGVTRGLARIAPTQEVTEVEMPLSELHAAVVDAEFVPEVEIGPALRNALDLSPVDTIEITAHPETGRLMLPGEDGRARDVLGRSLSADEVDRLILVNQSVQVPALSLSTGVLSDAFTLETPSGATSIGLRLTPNPCDFQAGDHLDPDGMGITRYPNELEPERAFEACAAAVETSPETGRFHYQLGRAMLALRDLDGAEAAFDQARELGHARAWYALGLVAQDRARSAGRMPDGAAPEDVLQFYARGVDAGDPYAFYSLGRQLMRFGGTTTREVEGYDLVLRSLEVGHTFAMNDLASFYLDTDNSYFDGERGLRYLRESASRGDIYGYNSLGIAHYRGRAGLEVDDATAYELFNRASADGHPTAPFNIARMYRDGRAPGGADFNRAVDWFAQGLERGHARSGVAAAEVIFSQALSDYDAYDGAVFAARAATLGSNRHTETAAGYLAQLPDDILNGAVQRMIEDLGGPALLDGAFGTETQAAMQAQIDRFGGGTPASDARGRALQMAEITWRANPFRVDLY